MLCLRGCKIAFAYYLQLALQIIRNATFSARQVAKKSQIAQFRNLQRNHTPAGDAASRCLIICSHMRGLGSVSLNWFMRLD